MSPPVIYHALTLSEWLSNTQALTYSQIRTYYYLLAREPRCERAIQVNLRVLAAEIGISKPALSESLNYLESNGYVAIDRTEMYLKCRPKHPSPLIRSSQTPDATPNASTTSYFPQQAVSRSSTHPVVPSSNLVAQANEPIAPANNDLYKDRARKRTKKSKDFLDPKAAQEKNSPALVRSGDRPTAAIQWPEGPWLSASGQLDGAFRDAIAQHWVQQWGGSLQDRRLHVLRHFVKDSKNLALCWEWYAAEYCERFEKASEILAAGGEIDQEYQQRLAANTRALTAELPADVTSSRRQLLGNMAWASTVTPR